VGAWGGLGPGCGGGRGGRGAAPVGTGEPGIKHLSIHERGPRQSESAQV